MNEDNLLKIGEVITFCNGHIYYDCTAIYNVFEMALSSMLYITSMLCIHVSNDVIMCSRIVYFPFIYFLTLISCTNLQLKT